MATRSEEGWDEVSALLAVLLLLLLEEEEDPLVRLVVVLEVPLFLLDVVALLPTSVLPVTMDAKPVTVLDAM